MKTSTPKKIFFLMPGRSPVTPIGGYKVVYEYANRLTERGYNVTIIYPISRLFKQQSFSYKLKMIPRFFKWKLTGMSGRKWFKLDSKVKEKIVLSLNWIHVPKSEVYIATEVHTSYYLAKYPIPSQNKLYFIQDYEAWLSSDEYVRNSYKLGLQNIVISNWLKEVVEQNSAEASVIKNGFDFDYFKLTNKIENRDPFSIAMLYHLDERKGCKYGIEALIKLHKKYPHMKTTLFGTPPRPDNLPEWMDYYQNPTQAEHNEIYNQAAVYLAPSIQEGWGLTVGEAMICGAAIVCTDAKGFLEMVDDKETGLVCECGNSNDLVEKVSLLFENNEKRIEIALKGCNKIKNFNWEKSVEIMETLINGNE